MFHINKQMVSSPSSSVIFFYLTSPPLSFPRWKEIVGTCPWIARSWCTNSSDSNPCWSECLCVCVYLGVCVCSMLVFVSVKLVWAPVCRQQPAGWVAPMTLWHMSAESILFRQHSLRLCNDLLTHTEEVEHTVGLLMSTYLKWQRCLFQQNHFAILNQIATVSLSQW